MGDVLISIVASVSAAVSAILSWWMTLHPPVNNQKQKGYKIGVIASTVCTVFLIGVQAYRANSSQAHLQSVISGAQRDASSARDEAHSARDELSSLRLELAREGGRREQAERSLESAVQRTGQETRTGVAEDIRKSPIKLDASAVKKPPELVSVSRLPREPHSAPPYEAEFMATVDQAVTPVRLLVNCSNGMTGVQGHILDAGAQMEGGWGGRYSNTLWGIGILAPAWTPKGPLLIKITSNQKDLGVCQFHLQ